MHHSTIEILEARIAPAAIVHYTDVDGDTVIITSSKGSSADLAAATHVVAGRLQLLDIESALFGAEFAGANLTFTVAKVAGGDGLANVGYINSTGEDLGTVTVQGDLGRIDAGDATTGTPGLKSLTAKSLGRFGINTQAAMGSLTSNLKGALGALNVAGDVTGVFISVTGGADGMIGPVKIGGSLVGGSTSMSGEIFASGNIGAVKITGDLQGGTASFAGFISSLNGGIASLTVGGSVIGGSASTTGAVRCDGDIGAVSIGGSLFGGSGDTSGLIRSLHGGIGAVTIGGSLVSGQTLGATNTDSGVIEASTNIGAVKIGHNLEGGTAMSGAGLIKSETGTIASVKLGGSLLGGSGGNSGQIISQGNLGAVTIGHDVVGGTGAGSALIASNAGGITSLSIGGSLVGGTKMDSGQIVCAGDLGAVKIGQDVQGGAGIQSGFIRSSGGAIASLTIGGSLTGGTATDSGEIIAHTNLGAVLIGHDVQGGTKSTAGRLSTETGDITSVSIGGSLLGGAGGHSGEINSHGDLGAVKVGHNFQGGAGQISGYITAVTGKIASVTIGGSFIGGGGAGISVGEIISQGDIGAVKIAHDFQGGTIDGAGLIRSFTGQIASLSIGGSLLGGTGVEAGEVVAHTGLGAVVIGHDLRGGTMSKAGRIYLENGALASLTIGGSLLGGAGTDSGQIFVHDEIGAVKIGHNFSGGAGGFSGFLRSSNSTIASIAIGGSLLGGAVADSGEIFSEGALGPVTIGHDLLGGAGTKSGFVHNNGGNIVSISIGGSFVGGPADYSGSIFSAVDIGAIKIGRDLQGGGGGSTGYIQSTTGTIASVSIGGSLIGWQLGGAMNTDSGEISSHGDLGPVTIGHDLQGGTVLRSGNFKSETGKIASVSLGGSVIGGAGEDSGSIDSKGDLGAVKIGHDVRGGVGKISGTIQSDNGKIVSASLGGSLLGGAGENTGAIVSGSGVGPVTMGRDLRGGAGLHSGGLQSVNGNIGNVSIGGSFLGGSNGLSGSILLGNGDLGAVKIGHDLQGGSGQQSGTIQTPMGKLASLTIGGSFVGGSNTGAGTVISGGQLGPVVIAHDLIGGSAEGAGGMLGGLQGTSGITSITIGGSIVGGAETQTGGIFSVGDLGPVKIGRDLTGGSITGSASIDGSGFVASLTGRIASVTIGGSVISGIDDSTGTLKLDASIRAANDIGSFTVKGSLIGNRNAKGDSPVIISARGQAVQGATTDLAIGKISIGGRVEFAQILAGYDVDLMGKNGDAQIGAVTVGGSWIASSIVAGANVGPFGGFGVGDTSIGAGNANIVSKIASITINGVVIGTPNPANMDLYGFVAQQIGSFHAAGFTATLTAGTDAVIHLSPTTGDVTIHEV